jgi:hypothetical protein
VAKSVGVSAEPEILEWNIKPEDRFAVIASDGVFEFITSQTVVNMIQKHSNKLEAAKQVVAEAYRLWLTFDDRTDDITIIIITFENIREHRSFQLTRGMSKALSSDELLRNSRPVRKVMSRAKRKDIAENWSKNEMAQIDFDKLLNPKVSAKTLCWASVGATWLCWLTFCPVCRCRCDRRTKRLPSCPTCCAQASCLKPCPPFIKTSSLK